MLKHTSKTTIWRREKDGVDTSNVVQMHAIETSCRHNRQHRAEGCYTLRQAAQQLGRALSSVQKGLKQAVADGVDITPPEGRYYRLTELDLKKIIPYLPKKRKGRSNG